MPVAPRPGDVVGRLADRMGPLVAEAVHPDEIAAFLEADGMTDEHIRLTYGHPDSFALAEELYARVPRAHAEPPPPPGEPWHAGLAGCLLRGLVFALPGLAYVLGAPLLPGPRDAHGLPAGTAPLLAGAVAGWVWNQALSHRAHAWLGLGDREAAVGALRTGAPAGALLGALVALTAAAPGEAGAALFAAGQALYLAAATVLLVLGRERALLLALAPTAAGALPALSHDPPVPLRVGLLLLSLGAAVGLAAHALLPAGPPAPRSGPGAPRLADSVPYGLFGLGTGVLVLYAAVGDVLAGGPGAAVSAPAAVALTLSMGPAEWLLRRFRGRSLGGLRASRTSGAFRRATGANLLLCLGGYLLVLLALTLAGSALWPGAPELAAGRLAGLLLLGTVLWAALLLQSFGAVLGAAVVCVLAAAAQTAALAAGADPRAVEVAVAGSATALLAVLVCALLGRATAHRP
ncbi:hypothetical protein ABT160_15480 [Streptomyces sp. NPDC001941]|uniref:hypothetical protein n=1 Tax=Streptomyces sp. NPDC001941 TaxID=3154659 RepID=UPI00331C4890